MRVLEPKIIIQTAVLLTLQMTLWAVYLYYFVRRRWGALSLGVHVASFLGFLSLFCFLMDIAILDLPFAVYYKQAGTIAMVVGFLVLAVTLSTFFLLRKNAPPNLHWPPDLKSVFISTEDLVVIVDYNDSIVETNHPDKLVSLLGEKSQTVDGLIALLREKTHENSHADIENRLTKLRIKDQFEIHFPKEDHYYLLNLTPIAAGRDNFLGATIVMHEITEKKKFEQEMQAHNEYLEDANQKLANDVQIANILEAEKERLSLLEQVQIDLINKIENTIAHVQHIQQVCYDSIPAYQKDIGLVADSLRDVYKDVRKSIQNISGRKRG